MNTLRAFTPAFWSLLILLAVVIGAAVVAWRFW